MNVFGDLLTAMITPYKDDGSVDYRKAGELAKKLADSGSDGVVVCGTTGESPVLSDEEKLGLFKAVVDAIGGKASVVAGTGSYSTAHSIHLTKLAEKAGVDGVMAVVPYYNKPPQEGLYQHFCSIASETALPVMLYNVPSRTSRNMEAETVVRLAELRNIVAVKEASGDMAQVAMIRANTPEDFIIYSGDDSLTLPILALGGSGVVSVAAHLVGRSLKQMIKCFAAGEIEKAREIHLSLMPLFKALFVTTNPIPIKAAVNMTGFKVGDPRLPLIGLDSNGRKLLKSRLADLGILD